MSPPQLAVHSPTRKRSGVDRCFGQAGRAFLALLALLVGFEPAAARDPVVKLGGRVERTASGAAQIRAIAQIAPGYHINAHVPDEPFLIPTVLSLEADGVEFAEPSYPEPESRKFAFAPDKPMLVYEGSVEITADASIVPTGAVHARLRYQACNEERCLAPTTVEAFLNERSEPTAVDAAASPPIGEEGSLLQGWLQNASLPAALGMTLVLGLTLNLTPCVYPLISVTLGFFGGQASAGRKPWPYASAYVVGITLSFAILGVSAALAGDMFGAPLQHPTVLIALAVLLIALALSSFGFYELRPPSWLLQRFGGSSAGISGALLMGLTMGLVAAPCIGPVVIGLLVYVGAERDLLKGFLLFSSMGLGMGLPYVFLASAAGSLDKLPRSGEWLSWMNRLFGVLLLAMAGYFVAPLLGHSFLRFFIPIFMAIAGIYLGFLEPSGRNLRGFTLARRVGGTVAVILATWMGLSAAQPRVGIQWEPLTLASLNSAIDAGRPSVVEFSAQWCLPCVEMEGSTFIDPGVLRESQRFSMLKADVTEASPENDLLLEQFGVRGVPTIIFYDRRGNEVDRVVGFVDAAQFRERLQKIGRRGPKTAPREAPIAEAA